MHSIMIIIIIITSLLLLLLLLHVVQRILLSFVSFFLGLLREVVLEYRVRVGCVRNPLRYKKTAFPQLHITSFSPGTHLKEKVVENVWIIARIKHNCAHTLI
jgi:type II secretory pathway pseudopilin PulG